MNIKVKLSSALLVAAAIILLFLSYQTLANAQTDPGTNPVDTQTLPNPVDTVNGVVPGGPGFVSINGGTFNPMDEFSQKTITQGVLSNAKTTSGYYNAPVMLPQGATVTQLVAYYCDEDVTHNLSVGLYSKTVNSGDVYTMAVATSNLAPGYSYTIDDSISNEQIDNQSNSYYSIVYLPALDASYVGLISIRVDYSFTGYLPAVIR